MRQFSPVAVVQAPELCVSFSKPTLTNAILVAAFRLPRAALARVVDDHGTAWQRANVTQCFASRLEVWMRWPAGLQHMKSNPRMPYMTWMETVPGPAGVRRITATVCNRIVLPICGAAIECRRNTKIGDAVELMHDFVRRGAFESAPLEARRCAT